MFCEEDFILPAFDKLRASNYNYPAIFGVCFIDLPQYIADDLDRLALRYEQLHAKP